jgi:NADH-quinone oxidoreductase subunit N
VISIIILAIAGVLAMFSSIVPGKYTTKIITILGLLAAGTTTVLEYLIVGNPARSPFFIEMPMLQFNHFGLAFGGLAILVTLLIVLISGYQQKESKTPWNEIYILILFSLCGVFCMVSYTHLLMLFLGVEILSIPLYVMAASVKDNLKSNEAGIKYFIMGSFASAILLFGIAMIYGAVGHFDIHSMNAFFKSGPLDNLMKIGIVMIFIGMAFKLSAVPFHFWSPDVYEGSPNIVTLYMATVVKTAAFAAFLRLMFGFLGGAADVWVNVVQGVAVVTLLVANIAAVYQTSAKRMLAYSSISQVGFLMIGSLAYSDFMMKSGISLYYIFAYAMSSVVLFMGIIAVCEEKNDYTFGAFAGVGKSQPFLAAMMLIAMLSLAGIPMTAGFLGKFYILGTLLKSHTYLVYFALFNAAISIYYYFKLVQAIYFTESAEAPVVHIDFGRKVVIGVAVMIIVLMTVKPMWVLSLVGSF